ncbi:MAG: Uma2 family endonuclease [Armatimonadetes bacterium]|nr:Uma2 family endonuclease [Armatimonadota bacterium]
MEDIGVGFVLAAPCDVAIRKKPLPTRQPDLIFVLRERIFDPQSFLIAERLDIAPDLVVGVLSPSGSIAASLKKFSGCHRIGASEIGFVNLSVETIEAFERQKSSRGLVGILERR